MPKENIPGIFNYCDRWCERCPFSSRCSLFESESNAKPDELDMKNKAFWERLSANFAKARAMLEESAQKFGVDLQAVTENLDEVERNREQKEEEVRSHALIVMANEYLDFATDWLKTQPGMMDKLEKLKENLTLGVESQADAKVQAETIKDCLSVIEWYMIFLQTKLSRALMGKSDAEFFDEDDVDQRDYDGSAKIAVIGMDRSMHAWARLFELLPEQEDIFLKVLSLLDRMKTRTLAEFPNAMRFVRPGFDEQL
jgi:hypothetical protein